MAATTEPTLSDLSDAARELLRGAIDIHVHADPDPYADRKLDAREVVARAKEAGLAGVVLKSHEYPTQPLAWALNQEFEGIRVYGALSLDHGVGGLNPEAVQVSMRIGATVCWMPTFDSIAWQQFRPGGHHSPQPGITVLDSDGALLPVVHEVLDALAEHDGVLASGHLSTDETLALVTESRRRGIRTVVTHASFWIEVEAQQRMAALGAYIEQCAIAIVGPERVGDWPEILEQVRTLGAEHVILSSDHGQAPNPEPVVALGTWYERFMEAGFSQAEVGRMGRENPAALLGD